MLTISDLFVYPIKSMGGIALNNALATATGFKYDRYWMLVDTNGNCLTQREFPQMALFRLRFIDFGIEVTYQNDTIVVPFNGSSSGEIKCHIWEDTLKAIKEPFEISRWFSHKMGTEVFLIRMAPSSTRYVKRHAPSKVHFPDSAPYMILGKSSLDHLNGQLQDSVSIDRFRANIVFVGGQPHEEDQWQQINIGGLNLESTKLCARCTVTTIDQETGERGEEPLLTLSKYRLFDRKIMFGHYFKVNQDFEGKISVGDTIRVLNYKS